MLIRTATPVIIRIPQSLYDQINVDNAKLKPVSFIGGQSSGKMFLFVLLKEI